MEPAQALQHWAKWAVDSGSWRQTCYSAEGRFAMNKGRYVWSDDEDRQLRVRYDPTIAQKVESLVCVLPDMEKRAMQARYVNYPHLADEDVARRVGISARCFDTYLMAAHAHFGRMWRNECLVANLNAQGQAVWRAGSRTY